MRISTPLVLAAFCLGTTAFAQSTSQNLGSIVASMRQDMRILSQRVGELTLRVEQLERENSALMNATDGMDRTYATVSALNEAVAELNTMISSGDRDTQAKAAKAIEELAKQTNSAVDSLAKGMVARAAITTPEFDTDFPKTGISYTIQRGDTLSSIASRFKSTVKDIQNANRIVDPTKIQVGQTLFIPGGE